MKSMITVLMLSSLTSLYSINTIAHSSGSSINLSSAASQAFNGLYIGARGGYVYTKKNITIRIPNTHSAAQVQQFNGHGDNFLGNVYFGYGYQTGKFHIAGEISVDTNKLAALNHSSYRDSFYRRDASLYRVFSVDMQPGFLISPRILMFGDIGVGYYHSDYDVELNDGPHPLHKEQHEHSARVHVGAGIAYAFTSHLSAQVLVQYTPNRTEHLQLNDNNTSSLQTNVMRYMIGISYSFS